MQTKQTILLNPINNIIRMKKIFSIVCACLLALSAQANSIDKIRRSVRESPIQDGESNSPTVPKPMRSTSKDFGAIWRRSTSCTDAFKKAIDALAQKGGGNLVVPQGVWFTGPITLKSNINLHIEKGGIILFSAHVNLTRS